jgi:hypothetical protein
LLLALIPRSVYSRVLTFPNNVIFLFLYHIIIFNLGHILSGIAAKRFPKSLFYSKKNNSSVAHKAFSPAQQKNSIFPKGKTSKENGMNHSSNEYL